MKVCVVQVQKISTWYTSAVAALDLLLPQCRDLLFKPEELWFNTKICDFPTYLCLEMHGKRMWKRGMKGSMVSVWWSW
jgi:hypothetical protein